MKLTPLSTAGPAANLPLEQLANSPRLSEAEKIAEASRQFEAVLLRQILQEGRKTVIPSRMNPESAVSGIYQEMVTNQLAESISRSGSFGLARSLQGELIRQALPHAAAAGQPHPIHE